MALKRVAERLYSQLLEQEEDGKKVYYKPLKVHPWLDKEGHINWKNLLFGGSFKRMIFPIMFLCIIVFAIYEYHTNFQNCQRAVEFYNVWHNPNLTTVDLNNLNFSNITFTP